MRYAQSNCTYTESFENGIHTYTFTGKCIITGKDYSVTVPGEGLHRYNKGEYIQYAFPDVSPEDRDFLLSGISPEAQAPTNPEGEEE